MAQVTIETTERRRLDANGYWVIHVPEHILIAEKALGHRLPKEAVIHHFDEDRSNNKNSNLVICESAWYHLILHARQRILYAGGDPNTQKICGHCKAIKLREEFVKHRSRWDGRDNVCRSCNHLVSVTWKRNNKEETNRQNRNRYHKSKSFGINNL